MSISELRLRSRTGETGGRDIARQRTTLAGDATRIRLGDNPANLAGIVSQRQSQIELPEMIVLTPMRLSIMKYEVTVGLFRKVMEKYVAEGRDAYNLQAILNGAMSADYTMVYVNLFDAREFAKRLSNQTGRNFRIQTEDEWLEAKAIGQIFGCNWTWTATPHSGNTFILRHLSGDFYHHHSPEHRSDHMAIRLVEDL